MSQIQQAASVLLARGPGSQEVFVVRRAESLRFFGGFLAFPGGKALPSDAAVPVHANGDLPWPSARIVAAARELFEETGVLVARRTDGTFPSSGGELDRLRSRLADDEPAFAAVLAELGVTLHARDFRPLGGLTTPDFVPVRFDTAFFIADLPPNQHAEVWAGELDQGYWATATDVIDAWLHGESLVSPPTVTILEAVRGRPIDDAPVLLGPLLRELHSGLMHPIYFAPAVQMIPLRTQALPPSTHTNTFFVGTGPHYLIDPGPPYPDEQQRLFRVLDAHAAAGRKPDVVVLTHHHPDHIGAAAVCAERYGVPVYAHPLTTELLRGKVPVAKAIHDGDRLDLGMAPDGRGTWHLEALHTPGHAPGHLAFYEPHYRLLLAGDMVSTLSSIVIAPPDGDLEIYLRSLHRLRELDCRMLLPSHGTATPRPRKVLDDCIEHRIKREEQLVEALREKPRTIRDLAEELYKGLPAPLMRFAELQLQAGLEKLRREGRAESVGQGKELSWHLHHE